MNGRQTGITARTALVALLLVLVIALTATGLVWTPGSALFTTGTLGP